MKILYDSQCFDMQKFGGVSRYFYKLAKYNGGLFDYEISCKFGDNIYLPEISSIPPFPIKKSFKGKTRAVGAINKFFDARAVEKGRYDVFHSTYYSVPKYPKEKPVVITVHDFIHEIFPQDFSARDNTAALKKDCLKKASRIIAISENTKKDLLKFYPFVDEARIDVVLHAIEWFPREKRALEKPFAKPYILFTGQRKGYKNFAAFARAAAPVLLENDLLLVCTGSPFNESERALLDELKVGDRAASVFADDQTLRALYENALLFVFPSLYEGFGLPILEAFVSNCPLLLSEASCFPEIAGGAALYFDPKSESDMKEKIAALVQSQSLRQELVQKGRARFDEFTLPKMMQGTAAVYQKALSAN